MSRPDADFQDGFLVYGGKMPGSIGICHLRVIAGSWRTVFLASELTHNPGPSVTNAIEGVWWAILTEFPHQAKQHPLLIEHYNDRAIYGIPEGGDRYAEARVRPGGSVEWYHRSPETIVKTAGIPSASLIIPVDTLTLNPHALEQEARRHARLDTPRPRLV